MSKVRLYYLLDLVIGAAFLLSGVTGVAFLFMGSGGYQGGRSTAFASALLGISRSAWNDLHTLTSVIMILGVLVHIALHWRWVVNVTQRFFRSKRQTQTAESCPA